MNFTSFQIFSLLQEIEDEINNKMKGIHLFGKEIKQGKYFLMFSSKKENFTSIVKISLDESGEKDLLIQIVNNNEYGKITHNYIKEVLSKKLRIHILSFFIFKNEKSQFK